MATQATRVYAPHWLQQVLRFVPRMCAEQYVELKGVPCVAWGVATSQLDLPSLTALSVAGCGRLQLGALHLATSVALLQVVDN